MKYNVNKKEKDIIDLTIELDKEEWAKAMNDAYEKNKSNYVVQGFRKGKAPKKAIENAYGSMVFANDAIDEVYKVHYLDIITKEELNPVSSPSMAIDKLDENGIKMVLSFQNRPTVVLGDYKNVEVKGDKATVTKKEIDEYIANMAKKNARKVEVTDRAVQVGDIVNIDFSGSVNGEKFEGGTAEKYDLEIGSHSFIEGFEEQIVGMKKDETKSINVTFPKEYHSADLAGKESVFEVKVNKITVNEQPEIDDKWASMVSEFETLEDFKKDIKKNLLQQKEKQVDTENMNKLIDKIVSNAKFTIPDCMIEEEVDYILSDFEQKLSMQGLKMDDYLKYTKKTLKEIRDEQKDIAKINCGVRLVLENILEAEKMTVEEKDLDKKIEEIAKMYGQKAEDMKKNIGEQDLAYMKNEILMDKLIAFLKENNKIIQ